MLLILAQTTQPAVDALDLVTKVDQFYNNAWNRLLFVIAIVGIAVPYLVQRYQQWSFDKAETELRGEISTLKQELLDRSDAQIRKMKQESDEVTSSLKREVAFNAAGMFELEATHHEKDTHGAVYWIFAAIYRIKCDETDTDLIKRDLNYAINWFDDKEPDEAVLIQFKEAFDNLTGFLEVVGMEAQFSQEVTQLAECSARIKTTTGS